MRKNKTLDGPQATAASKEAFEEHVHVVRPNKSEIKREMAAMFELADKLTALSPDQLAAIELGEDITTAIRDSDTMNTTKSARKRQVKFIAKQLRGLSPEKLQEVAASLSSRSSHGVSEDPKAADWRDRLIDDTGNCVLNELVESFEATDRQYVRQLQRNAQKELKTEKPLKSAKVLYKYLRELL